MEFQILKCNWTMISSDVIYTWFDLNGLSVHFIPLLLLVLVMFFLFFFFF